MEVVGEEAEAKAKVLLKKVVVSRSFRGKKLHLIN